MLHAKMAEADLSVREQFATTPDGWSLRLRRTLSPRHFDPATKPLLIVPGYGMNSFIFSYHPRGTSMERCLAEGGYEVWAMDLRGQGPSHREHPRAGSVSLANYIAVDVPAAVERVLASTKTGARALTMIGCSLGGSVAYGYLALSGARRVAGLIAMGAPLRWTEVHPLIKLVFSSPALAGMVRISNTRAILETAFPLLRRVPSLLGLYMNADTIDVQCMNEMTVTVEDPDPRVNRDIARWIRRGDLVVSGVDVTDALARIDIPLLVVLSNKDGIVPPQTALSVRDAWGGQDIEVLEAGDRDNWYAHANLFVANCAPERVFTPIISWLRRHP